MIVEYSWFSGFRVSGVRVLGYANSRNLTGLSLWASVAVVFSLHCINLKEDYVSMGDCGDRCQCASNILNTLSFVEFQRHYANLKLPSQLMAFELCQSNLY